MVSPVFTSLDDIDIDFTGICVPPYQSYFSTMPQGTYLLTVNAPGFAEATSSISIINGWQQVIVPLSRQ
ncbi:MAG: hypothetical protein V1489_01110 [Candidatus Liptonbacteria bacterium]